MPRGRKRVAFSTATIILLGAGARIYIRIAPVWACVEEQRKLESIFDRLQDKPETPENKNWNDVVGVLKTFSGNVFFAPRAEFLERTRTYRIEVEERFGRQSRPTLDDLGWAWDRLKHVSEKAAKYIDKHQPLFDQAMEKARNEAANRNEVVTEPRPLTTLASPQLTSQAREERVPLALIL